MNKGNLNKLVTNYPVSLTNEEVENLSLTLSAVRTAGGGGGEGKTYHGEGFVSVNNTNNSISLTTEANEKLNQPIPTKVSDLSDSANYQTVAGMDEYLTTANAQTLYQTKEAMSAYAKKTEIPDSITAFDDTDTVIYSYLNPLTGDIQQQLNGKQNKLQFDLNAKGEISAIGTLNGTTTALVGANGITGDYYSASNPSGFITSSVGALDNFYSKTDTSSKTEISNAFYNIPKYILNGDSNITATSAQEGNNVRWDLSVNATPVVTDTTLTGDKGIYTHTTTKSGEWCVELVQSAYAAINDVQNKLDTTAAAQTYQPKGDYVSSTDITDMATKTWVGSQGYINVIPSEYVTDTELQTTLGNYATNTLVQNTSAAIIELMPVTAGLASETDLQIVSAGVDYVSAHAITAHQPLTDYYTKLQTSGAIELSTEFGKYALKSEIPTVPTKVSDLTDSANYYKTTETSSKNELSTEFAKYLTNTQYNTDSATFALKTDLNYLVSSAGVTSTDTDYVMTTSGWKVLTLPGGGMTQVIHDSTLTGQGNADNSKLGLSQTAYNAITSVSSKLDTTAFSDVSGTFLTKSSADNDYAPKSVTATVNTLTAASAGWNNKVDKPTSLVNQYLVLRTDGDGNVSGWCDFQDQSYSKSEAQRTFVSTANIDTTTLSGDGKSVSTKLGVKTDVIATKEYVNSSFLPLSGGTVSGQLEVHGGSNFDSQFIKLTREGNSCGARIGLGSDTTNGTLALKTFNGQGQNTVQVNIKHNTNNNELIQVQKGGSDVGFLIPAVTATTTDGLTNDGILHIILES